MESSLLSNANWIQEVRKYRLNSFASVVRCNSPDQELYALGPFVGPVRITSLAPKFERFPGTEPTMQYDVYLHAVAHYTSGASFSARLPSYNLDTQPLELCLEIVGASMVGPIARSNLVRLRFQTAHSVTGDTKQE